jgi:hypothetical protein
MILFGGVWMKKRKTVALLAALVAVLVLAGCTTVSTRTVTNPLAAYVSFPADGPYVILGRVEYTTAQGEDGYLRLLEEAQRLYPEADDVVNILVDASDTYKIVTDEFTGEETVTKINSVYTMSAIAIAYTED